MLMHRDYAPRRDYRQRLPAHVTERPPQAGETEKRPGDLVLTPTGVVRIVEGGRAVPR